ncbi:MAG TPA: cytochrome c3 family protein [Coriobacteriia bacterium]
MTEKQDGAKGVESPPKGRAGSRAAGGRRRLAIAGAIALAVFVLLVVPGYLASRPGFFSRFPALGAQYTPWTTSTHAEVGCEGCHVPPRVLDRTAYRLRMVGEFYLSLIPTSRVPGVFATPTDEACLVCHSDLRTVSPEGDIKIPHRAHVSVLKMNCVKCHDFLVHEKSPEGKHSPPMSGCLKCHNGDTAKNACSACHTDKDAPPTHAGKDWLVVHGKEAVGDGCDKCHKWTAHWCADCHSQRPRSHIADWRATHGLQVARHRDCEACHAGTFCARCHGEVPALNLDPALSLVR